MRPGSPIAEDVPIDVVGSNTFGRYPKISISQTFNMIISDDWLVPSAGYNAVATIAPNALQGRGLFSSPNLQSMFAVIDDGFYRIDQSLGITKIANLSSFTGTVFMDANNAGQIAICDGHSMYIYDTVADVFQKLTLDFTPGYVAFQDTYFIAPDISTQQWRLSKSNDGFVWPPDSQHVGVLQTKPDTPVATVRFPGMGNMLFVFGKSVCEAWYDVGSALFPYQRNTYFNVDYGCLSAATIATTDTLLCWLGQNEKSGPTIMYSQGGAATQISNDGINFKLAELTNPSNSYGFIFRQDGHIIYVLTFPDDNISYAYDFNTQKFFTFTDEYMNYFIAKRVVFFNNAYYFVAFNDGKLYELSSTRTTFDGTEIPRVRMCTSLKRPDASQFICNAFTLTLEQGCVQNIQRVDLSLSKNGGMSYGNYVGRYLQPLGHRPNRLIWWGLGRANDMSVQLRFWGTNRFVIGPGLASIYQ